MSSVPAEIAGIGPTTQKLRVSPGFDPLKAAVGPDEYFVLSRIDGNLSLRDVLLATGLPIERGIQIVTRLRSIGALLLPGETGTPAPATMPARTPSATSPAASRTVTPVASTPRAGMPVVPPLARPQAASASAPSARATTPTPAGPELGHDLRLEDPSADELTAMAEDCVVPEVVRRRVLSMQRLIPKSDPHALLGVSGSADAKTLKRAYFLLSKEIHPDRYYGKQVGSFGERMSQVFEAASRAYARLTGTDKSRSSGANPAVRSATKEQPQTPQEYAAELFDRACQLEVSGDALGAMKLFAAAVRMDSQSRYLRRAASCALQAQQPKSAVEYAKKAYSQSPNDVSAARLLAAAFRAAGKLSDAEEVLVMAMAIKNENDVLTAELRNDLVEVRRLLASS